MVIAKENGGNGYELLLDDNMLCVRGVDHAVDFLSFAYRYRTSRRRPYLSILVGPSGRNVLESVPADHAHHLGVWWSHGDVGGVDFYLELEREGVRHGRIEHVAFDEIVDDEPWFGFDESLEWRGPDGEVLLEERRIVLAHFATDDWYTVDLDSTVTAVADVELGDTFESMLPGVRVAEPLAPWGGGTMTTSRGGVGEPSAMGEAVEWIDCSGPRRGWWSTREVEGIAVLSHPDNDPHPPRWWARDYGLVSPRPGNHFTGAGTLRSGDPLRLRHRLLVHGGDAANADVAGHYERWVDEASLE